MTRLHAKWLLGGFLLSFSAPSCSDSSAPSETDSETETPPGADDFIVDDQLPGAQVGPELEDQRPQCLGETREAEAIGLDMYVMLDISGSMLDLLPQQGRLATPTSKWDAVRLSLESFVTAPETNDIGIGIQYFPQVEPGVPFTCTSNQECGPNGGACTNSFCVVQETLDTPNDGQPPLSFFRIADGAPRFCVDDAGCGQGETCRTMNGECVIPPGVFTDVPAGSFLNFSNSPNVSLIPVCNAQADCAGLPGTICDAIGLCQNQLTFCATSFGCPDGAACGPFPYGCENQTRCELSDYSTPAVPISNAETRGADLIASLASQTPNGLTPTGPALQGALEHARAWADQNPDRQVVTVLVTDGFPTECSPLEIPDIADVARDALGGARPVRTFVVGVFGNADLGADGQERLDTLARAGGTDRALVVNTAGDVTQEFLNALTLIRDTTVSCEFSLQGSGELDFERVNLTVSDEGGNRTELFNVGDRAACGADDQGWYYVRDANGNPIQINVCPETCGSFMAGGVSAELQIGCATRIR